MAQAQSDRDVGGQALAMSARICPAHSTERTRPAVRTLPVGALRVLVQRDGHAMPGPVFARRDTGGVVRPSRGARLKSRCAQRGEATDHKVGVMTRSEEFHTATVVWDANGEPAKNVAVPAFEPRARPVGRYAEPAVPTH
ncbi:hypothetical protein VB151_06130 [Xanthomonas fragariae]|uniref:Uncharacterized protein n=1 Tax=Xanthomonas fragariae TaxID=48664 RepID=A0A1Y6HMX9_9XANT|nr:hypothetical protein [Xanthomonas fragariae]MBL9197193.1 hypothetical protein [Xanthomonas fragariae]MBL9222141.1 hypothetical protein [Xanthomonas fragariae]MDM7556083.1 hypothetical protein [Xanthomonas fragariae]MDM7559178.1 hypothetical protein [Xanthomonas fragariae]MDM7573767.1 hypothetical protein [Xanthomonas fragariae]